MAVTSEGYEGVGIEVDAEINHQSSFNHALLKTDSAGIPNKNYLMLLSTRKDLRIEFSYFCFLFLSEAREVKSDPVAWWARLTELIGNAKRSERVYPVLAELIVWRELMKRFPEQKWYWGGPQGELHDLEGTSAHVEVKSTLSAETRHVQVSSHGQLVVSDDKPLWIAFVRMSAAPNLTESIDKLVIDLGAWPDIQDNLVTGIEVSKLLPGNPVRMYTYHAYDIEFYRVDQYFPKLTADSFVGGVIPEGIKAITYTVDLDVLSPTFIDHWDPLG